MKRVLCMFISGAALAVACDSPKQVVAVAPIALVAPPSASASVAAPPPRVYRVTPDEPFRASPPPLADLPFTAPAIASFRLKNGANVLFVPRAGSNVVRVRVVLDTSEQPESPLGAATLFADCSWRGTLDREEGPFTDALDDAFGRVEWRVSVDATWIGITGPSSNIDSISSLLAEIVLRPALKPSQIERERTWQAERRDLEGQTPRYAAARVLPMALFGRKDPLDITATVRASDYRALSPAIVKAVHDRDVDPKRATFVVVGDSNVDAVRASLEKSFHAWKSPAQAVRRTPRPPFVVSASPRLVFVDRPQAAQSLVLVGAVGPARTSRDWYPALVTRALVGDSSGRLTHLLRDDKRVVSVASSTLEPIRNASIFSWAAEVSGGETVSTLREIDHTLSRMREEDVTQEELDLAEQRLAATEPTWLSTIDLASQMLSSLTIDHVPLAEVPQIGAHLREPRAADVRRIATAMFAPEKTRIVVVGDWAALGDPIRRLGFGPVELRDSNGAVIRVEPQLAP